MSVDGDGSDHGALPLEAEEGLGGPTVLRSLDPDVHTLPVDTGPTGPGAADAGEAALRPGELVAGRFTIVRYLAHGGMGEVYEAVDGVLGAHVALKTIRTQVANEPIVLERFHREVLLARRVTHPAVSRIFEIFAAEKADGAPVHFLTMELLRGETLAERLDRAGKMTPDQALPLVRQMAAGLAAAHAEGVVHRDFKASNVFLVRPSGPDPPDSAPGVPRVVITDFGIARALDPEESGRGATAGDVVGTPRYMAPEQLSGGAIGPSTDIYALGVVLYEMVTGQLPFPGSTPVEAAVARLQAPSPSPKRLVPELPEHWVRAILRCLERDPEKRYQSADEVFRALDPPMAGRRLRRSALGLSAVLLAAASLATLVWRERLPASPVPAVVGPASHATRRAVAVLGFRNLSGRPDNAWLSTAFAEMLTTELAAGQGLRTIPGEEVARVKASLSLGQPGTLGRDTVGRVRSNLGAEVVVLGSYLSLGSDATSPLRLDVLVQDTRTGDTLESWSESGTMGDLIDVVARAGGRLREKLGSAGLTDSAASSLRAIQPQSTEAARLYAEGVARLHLFDFAAARDRLEAAVAAEPGFVRGRLALAEAWSELGYTRKAREIAEEAWRRSEGLSPELRLVAEGLYLTLARDPRSENVYRKLFDMFPDDLEYGLDLLLSSQPKEALEIVKRLRQLPAPASDDVRIDLHEAGILWGMARYREALSVTTTAEVKARARDARLILAAVLLRRAEILWKLPAGASYDDAAPALDEAEGILRDAGDRIGVAKVKMCRAQYLINSAATMPQAAALFEEAVRVFREVGNHLLAHDPLLYLANLRSWTGDLDRALTLVHEAQAEIELTGQASEAFDFSEQGALQVQRGNLDAARDAFAAARVAMKRDGWTLEPLTMPIYEAQMLREEDRLDDARAALERAHLDSVFGFDVRQRLAGLDCDQGQPEEGLGRSRSARAQLPAKPRPLQEAVASAIEAGCLLARGDFGEALPVSERGIAAGDESGVFKWKVLNGVLKASAQVGLGQTSLARRSLEGLLRDVSAKHFVQLELETALTLGEVELKLARVAGRARLERVERDARARGFLRIARLAHSALAPVG